MKNIQIIALIMLSGAIGALSRYFLSQFVTNIAPTFAVPLPVLVVNILGCIIVGVGFALLQCKVFALDSALYYFVVIGFAGSFTTFSAFTIQNFEYIIRGEVLFCFANICFNVILSLFGFYCGYNLIRFILCSNNLI